MYKFKLIIGNEANICKYKNTKKNIHDWNANIFFNQQCLSSICQNEISFLEFPIFISF
jgi:hypothetical protein